MKAVNMFVAFVMFVLKVVFELDKNKYNCIRVVILVDEINYPIILSNYRSNVSREIVVMDSNLIGNYAALIDLQKDIIMLSPCLI